MRPKGRFCSEETPREECGSNIDSLLITFIAKIGILKNASFKRSPPLSPAHPDTTTSASISDPSPPQATSSDDPASDGQPPVTREAIKEITMANTQYNAGHRRSSSAGTRGSRSRRPSSRAASQQGDVDGNDAEASQRLKWDEANLYLTEQERTATMKITEPKTPYARHYDPAADPSDDEGEDDGAVGMDLDLDKIDGVDGKRSGARGAAEEDIPGLSLGEPTEAVPEGEFEDRPRAVHVNSTGSGHDADADETVGMTAEEREKHRRFERMRKQHYEMKNVAKFLGHSEELEDEMDEDDGDDAQPPVPPMPNRANGAS